LPDNFIALYDVTGIQKYIFSTSRLKDIIGASILVGRALSDVMEDIMKGVMKDFGASSQEAVIFSGGGNAIVRFPDHKAWKQFNSVFSRKLLLEMPGITFATVYNEAIDDSDSVDKRVSDLFSKMASTKALGGNNCEIGTLPPMAQCGPDNQPVCYISKEQDRRTGEDSQLGEYLSAATAAKRDVWDNWSKRVKGVSRKNIPITFDEIAKKPESIENAERFMAVVHLDGNQMGKMFKDVCEKAEKFDEISAFSRDIDMAYNKAMQSVLSFIEEKSSKRIRLIYADGDDVTYVCHCVYALDSVMEFMKTLQEFRPASVGGQQSFSACAGIAYVKPKFPFYRAFEIAKARCRSAKQLAHERLQEQFVDDEDIGCWVDFEVVRGSGGSEISREMFKRPYRIGSHEKDDKYSITKLCNELGDIREWPRSSSKGLRNAYLTGDDDSLHAIAGRMKSKGRDVKLDEREHLFDALDIADLEVLV